MNARFALAITILVFAAYSGHTDAAEPVPLHWNCARSGTPSLRETALTYGYDNYTRVVPARQALYRQIRDACAHGADRLVVVEPGDARRAQSRIASH